MRKFVGALIALVASLALVVPASAAPVNPLTDGVFGGELPCVQNGSTKVIECSGGGGSPDDAVPSNRAVQRTVPSWDGTPIDINFALPDPDQFGPGPYPMAMFFHGFGGGKEGFGGDLKRFTDMGVAAFSMTERGFKFSCGKKNAVATLEADTPGACDNGFIHLMDARYEVRDAQYFAGLLADEGLIKPNKIGTVGASYGGGKSANLAILKNRIMLPDGSLAPWKSPDGKDMQIAVAAPVVPWTDFAYSLVPNGTTLDYTVKNDYGPRNADGTFTTDTKFGTAKAGIITGLFPSGDNFSGDYPDLGFTPKTDWDIRTWKDMMFAGDPFDLTVSTRMLNEMTNHHSSYYINDSVEPAPTLIAQGLTDDLFPPDEALRLYNKVKTDWPNAPFGILMADIGHPRSPISGPNSQGRPADQDFALDIAIQWFSHYLLDQGAKPDDGVKIKTQVCPYTSPSGGPLTASNWASLSPGELRVTVPGSQTIKADGGSELVAGKFIDVFDACVQTAELKETGVVQIDFPVTPAGGFTLAGSPTVTADINVANGPTSQIAARLLEIKSGQERLIARGVYRPEKSGRQVFQLHGNAYHFEPGTRARLQLLPRDGHKSPDARSFDYVMPSNAQQDVKIANIDARLPVAEEPGSLGGLVKKPLAKPVPNGRQLMADYSKIGSVFLSGAAKGAAKGTVKGKVLTVKVTCSTASSCPAGKAVVKGKGKLKGAVANGKVPALMQGASKTIKLKLTAKARKTFKGKKKKKALKKGNATIKITGGGRSTNGKLAIKRTGKVK